MLQIDNTIISLDIFEKKFACEISMCKGACCVLGDSGAPLEESEAEIMDDVFEQVRPFMRAEGLEAVEKQGAFVIDSDGDKVTPLVNGKECAFVIFEGKVAKCAIEKAFEHKATTFRKPISCHLYPIRITKYSTFEALNYHKWNICKHAVTCGKKANIPLFQYLAEPLIRKYGKDWYNQLKLASEEFTKQANHNPEQ
jgi:hypothetical protein